jgi:hypothetical protein
LPPGDFERLRPLLEWVPFGPKRILIPSRMPIEHVHFVEEA